MMASKPTDAADSRKHPTTDEPFPAYVDWILAGVIAVAGLALALGGTALMVLLDRDLLAEGVESGTVTVVLLTRELSRAETLTVVETLVSWTGTGLIVTGVLMVAFAVAYAVFRRRKRRRVRKVETVSSVGAFAVLGAVITGLVSFLPFAPAVGGAVAGFLEWDETGRTTTVGALSGLLALLPVCLVLSFMFVALVAGLLAVGTAEVAVLAGAAMVFAVVVIAVVGAGLGAVGGKLGGRLAASRTDTS